MAARRRHHRRKNRRPGGSPPNGSGGRQTRLQPGSDNDCFEGPRRHARRARRLACAGRLATRLQPNHPRDDLDGIAAATYEGLAYGCGDALIGINPCIDEPDNLRRMLDLTADIIARTGVPTQNCVLGHITPSCARSKPARPSTFCFRAWRAPRRATRVSVSRSRCLMRARRRFAIAARSRRPT